MRIPPNIVMAEEVHEVSYFCGVQTGRTDTYRNFEAFSEKARCKQLYILQKKKG
jgi:hypothetical protein